MTYYAPLATGIKIIDGNYTVASNDTHLEDLVARGKIDGEQHKHLFNYRRDNIPVSIFVHKGKTVTEVDPYLYYIFKTSDFTPEMHSAVLNTSIILRMRTWEGSITSEEADHAYKALINMIDNKDTTVDDILGLNGTITPKERLIVCIFPMMSYLSMNFTGIPDISFYHKMFKSATFKHAVYVGDYQMESALMANLEYIMSEFKGDPTVEEFIDIINLVPDYTDELGQAERYVNFYDDVSTIARRRVKDNSGEANAVLTNLYESDHLTRDDVINAYAKGLTFVEIIEEGVDNSALTFYAEDNEEIPPLYYFTDNVGVTCTDKIMMVFKETNYISDNVENERLMLEEAQSYVDKDKVCLDERPTPPTPKLKYEKEANDILYRLALIATTLMVMVFTMRAAEHRDSAIGFTFIVVMYVFSASAIFADISFIGKLREYSCNIRRSVRIITFLTLGAISVGLHFLIASMYDNPANIQFVLVTIMVLVLAILVPTCSDLKGENHAS